MSIAQDLISITSQIDSLRKSQHDQQTYIDIKQRDNERLKAEVEVVEGEIEIVSRNKKKAIEDHFGHLKRRFGPLNLTTLLTNKRLLIVPVTEWIVAMVAVALRSTVKIGLNHALEELEKPTFIEVLEVNQKLPLSDELFVDIAKILALPKEEIPSHPIVEVIPVWLEAIYQMENLRRALSHKLSKLMDLNKQIEINVVAIDFSNKVIAN